MATSGVEVDCRFTCSICLELYDRSRRREAKLLPCFHTFCLSCLIKLVSRRGSTQEKRRSSNSLTCPICRFLIFLPPGGVFGFQRNTDLRSSNKEADSQPVLCTLCDRGHTAQVHCGHCNINICSQCRRNHDIFCQGCQDSSDSSSICSSTVQNPSQVRQQLQMVKDTLKKLSEEKKKLDQERQIIDDIISTRYTSLLFHAADACNASFQSLREVYNSMTEWLHSSMAEARQAQDTLQQQLSPSHSQPVPVSTAQLRTALFLQGELKMILNRDLDSCSLLHHHMEKNPSLVSSTLRSFMGSTIMSSQASGLAQKEPVGSLPLQDGGRAMSSAGADQNSLNGLFKKVEDLAGQVSSLQSTNAQLAQHVTLLSNSNSKLTTDHSTLQREVTMLRNNNVTLTTQHASLQREVTAMSDKQTIMHQDLALLKAEKDKVCAQLTTLQTDLTSVQTDMTSVQTGMTSVQTDLTSVQTDLTSVHTDLSSVHTDMTSVKTNLTSVKTNLTSVHTDLTSVQTDLTYVHTDLTSVRTDLTSMRTDLTSVHTDLTSVHTDLTSVQTDLTSVHTDLTSVHTDLTSVQTDLTSVLTDTSRQQMHILQLKADQGDILTKLSSFQTDMTALQGEQSGMKKDMTALQGEQSMEKGNEELTSDIQKIQGKLANLESRFTTANTQVGFHAWLTERVTTSQEQTLICEFMYSNEGGGYDNGTGVFTAPLTGTYCFLATISPNDPDVERKAKLGIVVDDVRKGYVHAMGYSWSTGHCVVKVRAGQRVWLRTYGDGEVTFGDGGWTSFSGTLLQAEV